MAEDILHNSSVQKDCRARSFFALMWAQGLGALNDNTFKVVVSLIVASAFVADQASVAYLCLTQAFFALPFILFSSYAGILADRFSKALMIRVVKALEILVMGLGFYFLTTNNVWGLLVVLFLMGLQSTLFSPCKYGILPELLEEQYVSKGNGYIELWTFLSIILGTVLGFLLKAASTGSYVFPGLVVLAIALGGFAASFFIPETNSQPLKIKFSINPFAEVFSGLREIKKDKHLFLAVIGTAFFWLLASYTQITLLLYVNQFLPENYDVSSGLMLAVLAIGVGSGSALAGIASGGKVELGLVPIGSIGLSISAFCLAFFSASFELALLFVFILGASGGMFIVPINAYLQCKSPNESRGRYIAASNFVAFGGVALAAFIIWPLVDHLRFTGSMLFVGLGIAASAVTVFAIRELPHMGIRCANWLLTHSIYRIKVIGKEVIPRKGGALIVCNHVSYVDPSLLLASIERPIRFLMYKPLYESKIIHPFAKTMNAIPIAAEGNPKETVRALMIAREAIKNGELVCIFAEGGITRIGRLVKFNKGFERIMKGLDAPIIPAYLDQLWGSVFSFKGGKFFFKWPKELPYRITVAFGSSLPPSSTADLVRQAVQELSTELFQHRTKDSQLLHYGFIKMAKRRLFRPCMADSTGKKLSYFKTLVSSLALSERLDGLAFEQKMVGVLLPTSVAGALANIALTLKGHVPVNLNYTTSQDAIDSAIAQCEIRTIVTSRIFIDKLGIEKSAKMYFLEEVVADIGKIEWAKAFLKCLLLPSWVLKRICTDLSVEGSDVATVIFSSGSTGEPKGVMLSHANVNSNLMSIHDIFQLKKKDCIIGILPFFHSFGYTGALWLPLRAGVLVVYHHNPVDAVVIGELALKFKATILLATPTFLTIYFRKIKPEQFKTLRYVFVGAEKLKDRVSEAFEKRFMIKPMEGYGCTELSPVAIANVPDVDTDDGPQVGHKPGTVGHPIPGVAVKVVDPDTFEPRPYGQDGMLLVKGPNVMRGYLKNEQLTAEVIRSGWYITGDIARMDEDGFVTITDRLSRFSKIGGEMVPHMKIEEELHLALRSVEQRCVVTAVADEKKGERLVVLYTGELDATALVKKLAEQGLPNLWIPRADSFISIEEMPLLGSGKLDLKAVRALAREKTDVNAVTDPI